MTRVITQKITDSFAAYNGDCVHVLKGLPDNSLHCSIFSPPFPMMYIYSNSRYDMGNVTSIQEMLEQCRFMMEELFRCMVPGRSVFVHLTQGVAQKLRDGYIGIKDLRGPSIKMAEDCGFNYYGEITIDKNPQALRNGSKVLTPVGWTAIEDLSIGDDVFGVDGKPQKVLNKFSYSEREMYRITFTDGAAVDCDGRHLWNVRGEGSRYGTGDWRTMTTEEIYGKGWVSPTGRLQWEIPRCQPVEFPATESLPLSAYLVGVLLGDGAITQSTPSFCTQSEIAYSLDLPEGCRIKKAKGTDKGDDAAVYLISHQDWHVNPVKDALQELGIYGLRAWEKHIPDQYMQSSIEDRKELLRGLLDTDGTIKQNNSIIFCTTSSRLASDVIDLVRSLGGLGLLRVEDNPRYMYNGEERVGRIRYLVTIQIDQNWCPFRLSYKVERWSNRTRLIRRKIANIEIVDTADCTCIEVSNDDGLFITNDFVVTHNCKSIRTRDVGLAFKSLVKDSAQMHSALSDFVLQFRKPGDNPLPIKAGGKSKKYPEANGWVTPEQWILWARPVWYGQDYLPGTSNNGLKSGIPCPKGVGIQETDTLSTITAKDVQDEKHLCALQLGVIERLVLLHTNEGEVVHDPFGGIGSTGYIALKHRRKAILSELKASYFKQLVKNLDTALAERNAMTLFDLEAA